MYFYFDQSHEILKVGHISIAEDRNQPKGTDSMTYTETFIKELREDFSFAFDYAELDDKIDDALRAEDFDMVDVLDAKLSAASNKYYELQGRSDAMLKKIKKDFPGGCDLVACMIEENACETWIDCGGTDEISDIVRDAFVWQIISSSYDTAISLHDWKIAGNVSN